MMSPASRPVIAATCLRRRPGGAPVAAVVEKDFWVCWKLERLFALPDPPARLIFKGGTSLSKVFGAIERFSEDVDLSFDRADLGFGPGKDPLTAPSRKKRQEWVKELTGACQAVIRDRFLPHLAAAFADALGEAAGASWNVESDPADPDRQTVLFHYPATDPASGDEPAYPRPAVRLEVGARSDHWPSTDAVVTPYAAEEFPAQFKEPKAAVRVLGADRTFWEKATILHLWHHAPADKPFRDRQSRHYYDSVRLYEMGIGRAAIADTTLLLAVAEHKNTFFPSTWAKYEEAKPGSLRLVPPDARLPELEADYRKMREMFFREPPPFEQIIAALREIEAQINGSA
jgi:hypothetical protein